MFRYGEKWETGDVIGITLDVDKEEIVYYRNGKSLGVAFSKLERGPGITYFPAVSLGYNQSLQANFGNMPFKYPVDGFMPLMARPIADLEKAEVLLHFLTNLSGVVARYNITKEKRSKDDRFSTKKTVYIIFCSLLIDKLNQILFNTYVIVDKFLPCIEELCKRK